METKTEEQNDLFKQAWIKFTNMVSKELQKSSIPDIERINKEILTESQLLEKAKESSVTIVVYECLIAITAGTEEYAKICKDSDNSEQVSALVSACVKNCKLALGEKAAIH